MKNFSSKRPFDNASVSTARPAGAATSGSPATNERKQDIHSPMQQGTRADAIDVKPAVTGSAPPTAPRIHAKPDADTNAPATGDTAAK